MTTTTTTTAAERERAYRLACHPITESRRIGLIDMKECLTQMRAVYLRTFEAMPNVNGARRAA